MSTKNSRYLLVIQDYFTKWADARPLPDQTAISQITAELVKLFCTYSIPEIVHSDQGRSFESSIVQSSLDAFGVQKSHTTPNHPQGDGMVERFNRSLLQLLRTYIEKQKDWEQHLPLALYVYRTTTHTSTGMSSFQLMYMYGRHPQPNTFTPSRGYEATSYQAVLQAKMAEQQTWWRLTLWSLHTGRKWTTTGILQSGHLSPWTWCGCRYPQQASWIHRWEGNWTVRSVKSPVTVEISDGDRTKVVHINRLHIRIQPAVNSQPGIVPNPATPANSSTCACSHGSHQE